MTRSPRRICEVIREAIRKAIQQAIRQFGRQFAKQFERRNSGRQFGRQFTQYFGRQFRAVSAKYLCSLFLSLSSCRPTSARDASFLPPFLLRPSSPFPPPSLHSCPCTLSFSSTLTSPLSILPLSLRSLPPPSFSLPKFRSLPPSPPSPPPACLPPRLSRVECRVYARNVHTRSTRA